MLFHSLKPVTRRLLATLTVAVLAAACSGSDDPDPPSATVAPTPTTERTTSTTEALTPEEEVEAAYLKSWDVYAKAMRDLDPSGLEASYAGEQLARTKAAVEAQAADGRPIRIEVEHDYVVELVAPGTAVVRDKYRNHSVFLDPSTGEPTEPDPDDAFFETFTLKEVEGTWKVVDILRESHSP